MFRDFVILNFDPFQRMYFEFIQIFLTLVEIKIFPYKFGNCHKYLVKSSKKIQTGPIKLKSRLLKALKYKFFSTLY